MSCKVNAFMIDLTYDRWIKSKSNENPVAKLDCPFCFGQLNKELIYALDIFSIQIHIVSQAWIEMGGTEDAFALNFESNLGIKCDDQGNIIELNWCRKRLEGTLSSSLGNLPRLETLYD